MATVTVGVLALQGGVAEHLSLLKRAAPQVSPDDRSFHFLQVRTAAELAKCDALIIPGGESTTMSIVAQRLGLLEPLREFVKIQQKPVWGTCAGLVLLAEEASAVKKGGQELIGGLDVKVIRNRYGTQIQSFTADLRLPFLAETQTPSSSAVQQGGEAEKPFRGVFIRAPVVEKVNVSSSAREEETGKDKEPVEIMGVYQRQKSTSQRKQEQDALPAGGEATSTDEDIVAVRQRNVFGTSFHPELTTDFRIHVWWLKQVLDAVKPALN
ncbi:class I glutamine amidotransferase-like protein [Rhypophila decipiens]|uniref:glutaminase n=1 Tax=Rhypophila decipiens TaxID=261697 RepID=A0AAN6XVT5_9PEZI|nr:class I glutamine amidotransferase-like protein [Rhypophila decipiens]